MKSLHPPSPASCSGPTPGEGVAFSLDQPTRWSRVWRASHGDQAAMEEALESICQDYWPPVYAYIRRQGKSEPDAKDLTQGFFCQILRRNWIASADPSRGSLRAYLFTCLINYLRDTHRSEKAGKRDSGQALLEIHSAERDYQREAVDHLSPDKLYQRRWALHLVDKAMEATARDYASRGNQAIFEALQGRLLESRSHDGDLGGVAGQLGMSPGAVRTALCRLRHRFRDLLFHEVGQTIASMNREEIRAEMAVLVESL